MKYFQYTKRIAGLLVVVALFASCKKADKHDPLGDAGSTIVKVINGGTEIEPGISKNPIDFVSVSQTIVGADVRRDIPNSAELTKTMIVTVKNDDAAVAIADPSYIILPDTWYTIGASTPYSGGIYTVTLNPGEFAKPILITIPDATVLDPSTLYALGFTITTADANGIISSQKTVVVEIGAKNEYDGIYSVEGGWVQRYTAPGVPEAAGGLNGDLTGNSDVIMFTVGAYTVEIPGSCCVGRLEWAHTSGGSGVAGIDGLKVTVDPASNLTTAISSGYSTSNATFGNWAGHTNSYDPVTKTFNLAWRWNPTGLTREYEIILKYKGPR